MDDHAAADGEGLRLPETTSRCVLEGATNDFEVTNSALLEGLGVDKYITSSPFSVGGYDWKIRFYPDGTRRGATAGKASAYLHYLGGLHAKEGVRAQYTITMLDDQGNTVGEKMCKDHVFSPESSIWGSSKFVKKSKLKSCSRLRLRCLVVVIKEAPTDQRERNRIVVPPPKLATDLGHALKNGRGTDVTLLVGDMEFRAHRFMLAARSPVLDAQLFGPMMDKDTQHIVVDDMNPAIFEMLLHFIYTDSLLPCDEEAVGAAATMQHLLVAADRYGLDRLKAMCEIKLCNSIDRSNVVSTLALANQHYCEALKDACSEFMSKPGVAADITDGFNRLMARPTPLILEENLGDKELSREKSDALCQNLRWAQTLISSFLCLFSLMIALGTKFMLSSHDG